MTINVLMPVFSTPVEWVQEAVESIIGQDHPDFRFIIVDDNNPRGPLTKYLYGLTQRDCCVNIIHKSENEGIAAALDFGLKHCQGDLIVRMDADDIADKNLLKTHDHYFSEHPDRHICGVQIHLFNKTMDWYSNHPAEVTRKKACWMNGHWFVNHPGVAFRKEAITNVGGYGATPSTLAEDYALWVKFLLAGYTIYNSEDILIKYRVHEKSFSFAPDRKAPEWHEFLRTQKLLLNEQ
ncbi:MAG: glycosyltransferase [Bacteroidales bacterium]|nr:glycosyltransferase [Bacteroidales bacterium]